MSYSKRELYALGEPLGDCVTRAKPGGGRVMGGGGDSSSSQATHNTDQRVVVQDGVGLSGSNNNHITFQRLDANIVNSALGTVDNAVKNALDSVNINSALYYEGWEKLLDFQQETFNAGQSNIGQLQKHVADAYTTAHAEKAGTIDNRTVIILGVALVAGVALIRKG